ncbi:MAG: hypothetical protein ACRC2K_00025 [Clostridium sp.]
MNNITILSVGASIGKIPHTPPPIDHLEVNPGGSLAIFIFAMWLIMILGFLLSFSKNTKVATTGFVAFSIINGFSCYSLALAAISDKGFILHGIRIVSLIFIITSIILWFKGQKKDARKIGIISMFATIWLCFQMNNRY